MGEYIKNHDIILFSETKLQRIPQSEFPDYDIFTFKQKTRLHGLALLIKNGLFKYTKKLNATSKCVLWVIVGSSERNIHFIVGSVYIPGYDSKFSDHNDFGYISEDILTLGSKYNCPFVLIGDFNARSGNLNGFNDPVLCDTNQMVHTVRSSKDNKIDTYGRNLIKMCNDVNLKIVNGGFGSDSGIGNYTCHKKRYTTINESVVDYCLVSDSMLSCIADFSVDTFDRCMSDVHSPICLKLKNVPIVENAPILLNENYQKIPYKAKWNPELKNQ